MFRTACILGPIALCVAVAAMAQSSPSHDASERVLNAGGAPADGVVPASASFRVTLASIGESIVGVGASSPSFRADGSFAVAYVPPGEVTALGFSDPVTLEWAPEASTGAYNVYRGPFADLASGVYGACFRQDLAGETTTDDALPAVGDGFYYLVTATNRLDEEGTKGLRGDGTERVGDVCP